MLVKCKGCGNKIERETAFKWRVKDKNTYYCSIDEFTQINEELEAKKNVIDFSLEILENTTNTALFKELTELSKRYTYKKMSQYIEENKDQIYKAMSISFQSDYGKIRYFTAILKNSLGEFIPKVTMEDVIVDKDVTVIEEIIYKPTTKKSILDYIDEY